MLQSLNLGFPVHNCSAHGFSLCRICYHWTFGLGLGKFRVLCAPYLGLPDAVLYLNIYCNVLASYLFLKCYMIIELKWKVSEMLYRVVCLGLGLHMCFHDSSFLRLFSNVSGDDFLQVTMETYRLMDQDMNTMCDPRNCLSIQMTNIH